MSRHREYLADAEGALLTRYPPGLASALKKIQAAPTPMRRRTTRRRTCGSTSPRASRGRTTTMERLFSTHPPIQERIRRLEEM